MIWSNLNNVFYNDKCGRILIYTLNKIYSFWDTYLRFYEKMFGYENHVFFSFHILTQYHTRKWGSTHIFKTCILSGPYTAVKDREIANIYKLGHCKPMFINVF